MNMILVWTAMALWAIAAVIEFLHWREKRDRARRPWRYRDSDGMTRVERAGDRAFDALFRTFVGKTIPDLIAESGLDEKTLGDLWASRRKHGYMGFRAFLIAWNRGAFRDWPIVDGKLVKPAGAKPSDNGERLKLSSGARRVAGK